MWCVACLKCKCVHIQLVYMSTNSNYIHSYYTLLTYTTIGMNEFSKYGFTVPECYYYDSVENYLSTSFLDGTYVSLLHLLCGHYIYITYYIILYVILLLLYYMCYIVILHSINTFYIILYILIYYIYVLHYMYIHRLRAVSSAITALRSGHASGTSCGSDYG